MQIKVSKSKVLTGREVSAGKEDRINSQYYYRLICGDSQGNAPYGNKRGPKRLVMVPTV